MSKENLLTPVQYAKLNNMAPQVVYSHMKRGLPTHQQELKGKMRDLVDPTEATEWIKNYELTKGRKGRGNDSPENRDPNSPRDPRDEDHRTGKRSLPKGQLLTYERMPGHISVGKVSSTNDYYCEVERNVYNMAFILNKCTKQTFPLTHETVKAGVRDRKFVVDTPLQVLQYVIESMEHIDKAFTDDLKAAVEKHIGPHVQKMLEDEIAAAKAHEVSTVDDPEDDTDPLADPEDNIDPEDDNIEFADKE